MTATRGLRQIQFGRELVDIRFRAHEVALLEEELGMGIVKILSPDQLGINVLRKALLIGASAGYAHKHVKKRLNMAKVTEWVNDWPGSIDELLVPVMECVAEGLPGLDLEEEEEAEEAPGKDE